MTMTDALAHNAVDEPAPGRADATVQLAEEVLVVGRRLVAGDTVRVATHTEQQMADIAEELVHMRVEIERVPVGRVVQSAPETRVDGDVTIIPVMEEVLVVERRLVLKEEIRITRIRTREMHRETVQLRRQMADISRTPADQAGRGTMPDGEPTTERDTS